MSYDMSIGEENFNYTYNVSPMWYASKPDKGIRCIYGLTGKEALKELRDMKTYMEENWDDMVSINPENRWGSAAGAYDFLCRLSAASARNQDEKWDGD